MCMNHEMVCDQIRQIVESLRYFKPSDMEWI